MWQNARITSPLSDVPHATQQGVTGTSDTLGAAGDFGFGAPSGAGAGSKSNNQILFEFYQQYDPSKTKGKTSADMQGIIDKKTAKYGGVEKGLNYIQRFLQQKYNAKPVFVMPAAAAAADDEFGWGGGGADMGSGSTDQTSVSTLESAFGGMSYNF